MGGGSGLGWEASSRCQTQLQIISSLPLNGREKGQGKNGEKGGVKAWVNSKRAEGEDGKRVL